MTAELFSDRPSHSYCHLRMDAVQLHCVATCSTVSQVTVVLSVNAVSSCQPGFCQTQGESHRMTMRHDTEDINHPLNPLAGLTMRQSALTFCEDHHPDNTMICCHSLSAGCVLMGPVMGRQNL